MARILNEKYENSNNTKTTQEQSPQEKSFQDRDSKYLFDWIMLAFVGLGLLAIGYWLYWILSLPPATLVLILVLWLVLGNIGGASNGRRL